MIMNKYILPLAAVAVSAALTACNDDNDRVWVTDDPNIGINLNDGSYSTLTFEWDKVDGVNQYGYELAEPDGTIAARGVTDDNTITFNDLKADTTYTLTVYVYGPDGTTTRRIVITATTKALVKLAEPEVTASQDGARINITWTAVENADYYHYSYLLNGEEVSADTEDCRLQLRGIPTGSYTISVTAMTDTEGFISSDAVNCGFTRSRQALWSAEGDYSSSLLTAGSHWKATLTAYNDGSYVIAGWYGVDGYDLEFTLNSDNSLDIETDRLDSWGYYLVPSGKSSVPEVNLWPYTDQYGVYSAFDGNEEYGQIWCYVTDGGNASGYDIFEWGNDEPDPVTTVDLSGTYNVANWSGYESYWYTSDGYWHDFSYNDFDVTISQTGNSVTLTGFIGGTETIIGTVDAEAKTITFAAQDIIYGGYYYRFAYERDDIWTSDSSALNDSVVATFDDDGNIDLSGWGLYYIYDDGSFYAYFSGITQNLEKKAE